MARIPIVRWATPANTGQLARFHRILANWRVFRGTGGRTLEPEILSPDRRC